MSEEVKPLIYLWKETEEARKDACLVSIVRGAQSAAYADKQAQEYDFPTYLCRQTRLLYQIREEYKDAWAETWNKILPLEYSSNALTHAYYCEWEVEGQLGHIEGDMQAGTLVVSKNAAKAAVLWDYTLCDDTGTEVAHSKNLGRQWFLQEKYRRVNCYLNHGSPLIPRVGLKISFSVSENSLHFWRDTDNARLHWQRYLCDLGDGMQPCIMRTETIHGRRDRQYVVHLRPLSSEDRRRLWDGRERYGHGEWGLFFEMSFLKERKPGGKVVKERRPPEPRLICYQVTHGYSMWKPRFENFLTGKGSFLDGDRFPGWKASKYFNPVGTWDVTLQAIGKNDEKRMEEIYEVVEESTEDILASFHALLPERIDGAAAITHLFDLRKSFWSLVFQKSDSTLDW